MIEILRLIWDEQNVAHIAWHNVTPQEVEDVCQNNQLVQQGHHGRRVVIGATHAGRMLEVVLDPEPGKGVYCVVTVHLAIQEDRALYLYQR